MKKLFFFNNFILVIGVVFFFLIKVNENTVTSCLFTHIVSTEKMLKEMRDRKDMGGTNYTYNISCFLILLLTESSLGTFPLLTTCLLYL